MCKLCHRMLGVIWPPERGPFLSSKGKKKKEGKKKRRETPWHGSVCRHIAHHKIVELGHPYAIFRKQLEGSPATSERHDLRVMLPALGPRCMPGSKLVPQHHSTR